MGKFEHGHTNRKTMKRDRETKWPSKSQGEGPETDPSFTASEGTNPTITLISDVFPPEL